MLPLEGIRVLELGHALAAPFATSLLGDFGAEIVKIEQPGVGDSLRAMGPLLAESSVWWSVTGRNKLSVTINYKDPAGLDLVKRLLAETDVLVENFRPGVLDRAGLGWADLHAEFPRLVMLSISGYGEGGPYSDRPGFGKIAEAFSGATHLTGEATAPPTHPGYSLGDATTGLMGAFGVLTALRARDHIGTGQRIDLALYESLFRMIEWQVPLKQLHDWEAQRQGSAFPFDEAFLTDICTTADGHNIVVSAATTKALDSIRRLLTDHGIVGDARPSVAEMTLLLRGWITARPREEALAELRSYDVVVGPVHSATDLLADPHVAARENIVTVTDDEGRSISMPNVVPKLSETPGNVQWPGPALGHHTESVLRKRLGLTDEELETLSADGVLG